MDLESTIWSLRLPLKISLSTADVKSGTCGNVAPMYITCPAISYLPLVLGQVESHFKPDNIAEAWFSFQGSPIRWHLPCAVLRDLFKVNTDLWEINVHFGQFPQDDLERLTPSDAESAYQMAVKEADQIRAKSTNIAQFQQTDWKRLWHSVVECDVAEWAQVANKLQEAQESDVIPAKFHFDRVYFQLPLTRETTLHECLDKFKMSPEQQQVQVWHLGVQLSLDVQLGQLARLTYPDTFLHLVIQQH